MKTITLLLTIFSTIYANDIQDILKMTKLLKTYNITYKPIKNLYNPFVVQHKIQTVKKHPILIKKISVLKPKKTYHLEVIFSNKVRINGQWYKNYDKIDDYVVIIKNNKVFLKHKNHTILLQNKHNSLLKVSE